METKDLKVEGMKTDITNESVQYECEICGKKWEASVAKMKVGGFLFLINHARSHKMGVKK